MVEDNPPPRHIIEAKALKVDLDLYRAQLSRYMGASPKMTMGVAVLTNGRKWRLYDASKTGRLAEKFICEVDIKESPTKDSATVLIKHIGKNQPVRR